MKLTPILAFKLFIISAFIIAGCDQCDEACQCKDEDLVHGSIQFDLGNLINTALPDNRTCTFPFGKGDPCDFAGNNFLDKAGTADKYFLWVTYETPCDKFYLQSQEFQDLQDSGVARAQEESTEECDKIWKFTFALNTEGPNCSPSIPYPILNVNSNTSQIANLTLHYLEPCINFQQNCFSEYPCFGHPTRPKYELYRETLLDVGTPNHVIPIFLTPFENLQHVEDFCSPTEIQFCL